jgi:hypothetical protein
VNSLERFGLEKQGRNSTSWKMAPNMNKSALDVEWARGKPGSVSFRCGWVREDEETAADWAAHAFRIKYQ